jgi:hypothetical protein
MPRARSLKPGFFTNEHLGALPPECRLLFQGLWTQADRAGRLEDRPARLKVMVCPFDAIDVDAALTSLEQAGFIRRYVVNGIHLIAISTWSKHQRPHPREPKSELPPPPDHVETGAKTQSPEKVMPGREKVVPGRVKVMPGPSGSSCTSGSSGSSVPLAALAPGTDPGASLLTDQEVPPSGGVRTTRRQTQQNALAAARVSPQPVGFHEFWNAYPKRKNKCDAIRAWQKLNPDAELRATILNALAWQCEDEDWIRSIGIPHPAKYLTDQRWLDEPPAPPSLVSEQTRRNLRNIKVAKEVWLSTFGSKAKATIQ